MIKPNSVLLDKKLLTLIELTLGTMSKATATITTVVITEINVPTKVPDKLENVDTLLIELRLLFNELLSLDFIILSSDTEILSSKALYSSSTLNDSFPS